MAIVITLTHDGELPISKNIAKELSPQFALVLGKVIKKNTDKERMKKGIHAEIKVVIISNKSNLNKKSIPKEKMN